MDESFPGKLAFERVGGKKKTSSYVEIFYVFHENNTEYVLLSLIIFCALIPFVFGIDPF